MREEVKDEFDVLEVFIGARLLTRSCLLQEFSKLSGFSNVAT